MSAKPAMLKAGPVKAKAASGAAPATLARVLVPLDGSLLADDILGQVRRLLVRQDAEVRLLRVVSPAMAEGAAFLPNDDAQAALTHLERHRDRLRAEGASVDIDVRVGDPAAEILGVAEAWNPSLIAMSTHGRTGPARWLLGSVAERVVRGARHPVLLANRHGAGREIPEARFRRILVPVDGSPESEAALPLALAFGRLYEAEIVLLHVGPDPAAPMAVPYVVMPPVPSQAELAAVVEPARAKVVAAGRPVQVRTRYAHPAAAILDTITEEACDLVVMATHGRSGVSRWVFGSVTEKVVRHASRPVLVCRAPNAGAEPLEGSGTLSAPSGPGGKGA